jgi:Leucine-rich repeat (LRR) protein
MGSTDTTNHTLALQMMKGLGMPAEIKVFLEEWRSFFQKTEKKAFSYAKVLETFVDLRMLFAENIALTQLPASYKLCHAVERVWFSKTQITHLPPSFFDMPLLQLYITDTPLQSLPTEISKCHTLEVLHITNALIKRLPASLGNLSALKYFSVMNCTLKSLPASLEGLKALMSVDFQGNQLKQIPKWLLTLPKLHHISLQNNHMKRIPKWFRDNYWWNIAI